MKKPLFLNRTLHELDIFRQNIYLHNKLNSTRAGINKNNYTFNSERDWSRGLSKKKRIFINYIISFIYL
jgi:hypothetical protein